MQSNMHRQNKHVSEHIGHKQWEGGKARQKEDTDAINRDQQISNVLLYQHNFALSHLH